MANPTLAVLETEATIATPMSENLLSPTISMHFAKDSRERCFVPMSGGCSVPRTLSSRTCLVATSCCSHKYFNSMCLTLPRPWRLPIAIAELASICNSMLGVYPQNSKIVFTYKHSAATAHAP